MNCDDVQSRLTAYLDGELADDRGSAIRGHLRSCEACRQVSADEGALRDGLRALPSVDPPPSLWAAVQAQLATAEVADSNKPAWKRTLARWSARFAPSWPTLALGGVAAAAVVTFVIWRTPSSTQPSAPDVATAPAPLVVPASAPASPELGDITDDLASEAGRVTDTYADAAEELLVLATEARGQWAADQQQAFDARVAELRGAIASAALGRPQQTAWRALIRYLQNAAVRDEVALASGGMP